MNRPFSGFFIPVRLPYKRKDMKKLITLTALTITCLIVRSQSIERKLVGTAGTVFISNNYQLSFSVGEVMIQPTPAVKITRMGQDVLATIGFQQPHVAKTGAIVHANNWVSAYPNPAVSNVRLDVHGDNFQTNYVKVFNAAGQSVLAPFVFINGSIDLNVSKLAAGVYFVAVTDKVTGHTVTTKIIKQN